MPRTTDSRPYVPLVVLTDAATGRRVCVSGMWMTTFTEAEDGTIFRFTNGETFTVEESFMVVADQFGRASR